MILQSANINFRDEVSSRRASSSSSSCPSSSEESTISGPLFRDPTPPQEHLKDTPSLPEINYDDAESVYSSIENERRRISEPGSSINDSLSESESYHGFDMD